MKGAEDVGRAVDEVDVALFFRGFGGGFAHPPKMQEKRRRVEGAGMESGLEL